MARKATLESFIQKAQLKEKARLKFATFTSAEYGDIILEKTDLNRILEIVDDLESQKTSQQLESTAQIVYESIPMLREEKLLDSLGCLDNPLSVVYKVFSIDEIELLVENIMKLNGLDISLDEVKK